MERIKNLIAAEHSNHEIVVFNSHSHWDHWWGNAAFTNAKVIAHSSCQDFIREQARAMLEAHSEERNGEVKVVIPNITFNERLSFEDDGILFLHTPGHSEDSCSCIDLEDRIAYIGDLVEEPIPYLEWHNLPVYEKTLLNIASMGLKYMIAGHTGIVAPEVFSRTLRYLTKVKQGKNPHFENKQTQEQHIVNLRSVAISEIESEARYRMGSRFNYDDYWYYLESLNTLPIDTLKTRLRDFFTQKLQECH